ncbi:ribose-phosphate pyrophosphokinase-like domain-containing protein, partial [Paenibacillus xylanexedens]|uniref:ribose-phosphate pyrophosphokinase-like domain-containing protein n=1 Tax=Paenibacillus xylanexedens TaxID=528191 RepID=UPI001642BC32
SVHASHVYILQSTSFPLNHNFMQILVIIHPLKPPSPKTINLLIPYYPYPTQHPKPPSPHPITPNLLPNLIQKAPPTPLIPIDLHPIQI